MTRRPTAPDSALTARTIGSLLIVGAYIVFRLRDLTSPWEAALTWVGAVVCGAIAISSIEELGLRRYFRAQRVESIRDAITETFAVPARWPDEVEHAIATARHSAMQPLIDRGEVVEPTLFTHEFQPLTPAHGIDLSSLQAVSASVDDVRVSAVEILQRLKAEGYVPADTPARHAAAHIARDRFGQLFGTL
jgi:hypothetical protein